MRSVGKQIKAIFSNIVCFSILSTHIHYTAVMMITRFKDRLFSRINQTQYFFWCQATKFRERNDITAGFQATLGKNQITTYRYIYLQRITLSFQLPS